MTRTIFNILLALSLSLGLAACDTGPDTESSSTTGSDAATASSEGSTGSTSETTGSTSETTGAINLCCKVCTNSLSKACGDSCILLDAHCPRDGGCACDG